MTIKIREINDTYEFLGLKQQWETLLSYCNHTVFSTWEWLTTWWKHFGADKGLLLLIAEDDGVPIGIAPLMYSSLKAYGFPIRKVEFIGTPKSDYNNFILARNSDECIKLFLEKAYHSFQKKWDSIELDDISEPSTLKVLKETKDNLQTVSIRSLHECFYIDLPNSYDSLYNNLEYKFRQNLRRSMRNLEKNHKVEFVDYSTTDKSDNGMQILFDLHQKRWKAKGDVGAFADPAVRRFNLDLAKNFAQLGWLSLNSMNVDGIPAASAYGFKYHSKFYYYLHGIHPAYHRYSVGNLLVANLLKKSIVEQVKEFDFLRGDESYKGRWTLSSRKNFNVILTKKRFTARTQNRFLRTYCYQIGRLEKSFKRQKMPL
jgi:CelD/BcsL family acetyltransferase involved in cellulose biosynthesis